MMLGYNYYYKDFIYIEIDLDYIIKNISVISNIFYLFI